MPQPVTYNPGTPVSGSIQENSISYVVDGQNRNYRGGFGGLSWMSEVPAANNVIFIGNSTSLGRGPANIPLFYPSYNNSAANIIYAANTLPGSPRNFTTTGSAYNWAATNNFFINNSDNPIPRINGDSLGLYIDANQPTSYPQTGTTWFDLSGIGNNCGLYNGPTWNSNGYIQFDGTDDFVGVGNTGVTKLNQNYQTLRFLIYITSVGPNGYSELYAVTNANRTGIKWQSDGIGMDANGDFYNVFVNVSNAYSQWMDITCVIDRVSTIFKVYKNGTYIGQHTFTGYTANSTDITIGANRLTGNGGDYIKGNISEVSVYGKELSLSEIKQNYFQSNIVTGSLVFMVDANNLVSYPKSGTTWYNLTGSSGNALFYNGPTYLPQYGGGINRDNTDDFISASISVSTTTNYSVETWFKANPLTGANYNALISAWNAPGGGAGSWELQFLNGTLGVHPTYTVAYTPNTVAHAVYTQNGTETKIYLNGVLQQTSTTSGVDLRNGSIGIGNLSAPGYGGYNLEGTFYNVKLYNKTLTSDEVQQNYQATKDKFLGENIVTNGLVLNLDSANKDSYPGTGTTWTDLSGNGNNGTLTNGPLFLSNQNGGVIAFDGVDDYVGIANNSTINPNNGSFTIVCWVNSDPSSGGDGWDLWVAKRSNGSNGYYVGVNNPSGVRFMAGNNANQRTDTGFIGYTYNTWAMFTAVLDRTANTQTIIRNNFEQSSSVTPSGGTYDNSGTLSIGGDIGIGSYFVNGKQSIVLIYNRALSAAEIAQNYNATKTRFGL